MSKSLKDQKQQSYTGLRFGSLSGEQNEEMQKAMLNGLKAINNYFESSSGVRKNLLSDMKMATTAVNTYAKLRQADSGFAMILLQLIKMSGKEDQPILKSFVLGQLAGFTES